METAKATNGSIKATKLSMGHTAPQDRIDTCAHCKHGEAIYPDRMPPYDKPFFYCNRGNFRTSKMAVCEQHEKGK